MLQVSSVTEEEEEEEKHSFVFHVMKERRVFYDVFFSSLVFEAVKQKPKPKSTF